MRFVNRLGVLSVAVLAGLLYPSAEARAVPYTLTFLATTGTTPAPSSLVLDFDHASGRFTNFVVTWNSISYDFGRQINNSSLTVEERQHLGASLIDSALNSWSVREIDPGSVYLFFMKGSNDLVDAFSATLSGAPGLAASEGRFMLAPGSTLPPPPPPPSIPEPTSLVLLGTAMSALAYRVRRTRRSAGEPSR